MKLKKLMLGVLSTAFVASLTLGLGGCDIIDKAKKGKEQVKDILDHLNSHHYVAVVTSPTCTEDGYTTHTCTCGESYVDTIIPALGHEYENGFCSRCKESETIEELAYMLSYDGQSYSVAGFGTCTNTDIVIPSTHKNLPVSSIGSSAFKNCKNLASVVIGNNVTSIGSSAFENCSSLTSVEIGDSVTSIGENAFYDCSSLTSITIPESVTSIGDGAFLFCDSLTSVEIGDSVTSIGVGAFSGCSSLTSVVIPDSVTSISNKSFSNCSKLVFNEYGNAKYLGSKDNEYFALIEVKNKDYSSYTIHENTKVIADYAFSSCDNLTSVVIPDSVTSIGGDAFYACGSLESIIVSEDNTAYQSIDENLYSKDGTILIQYAIGKIETTFKIPDSVTSIGDWAFEYCSNLTSVVIPDSVTSIGDGAFSSCSSLTSVVIPDSVTSIGDYAFHGCSRLTSVEIPDSVTSIGVGAFYYCDSLTSVTFKDTTTWYRTNGPDDWKNQTGGKQMDMTDPSQNASYLKGYGYWYKKDN